MRLSVLPIASILLLASAAMAADPPVETTGSTADQKPVVEVPKATDPATAAPNTSQPAQLSPEAAKKAMADAQRMQRIREKAAQVDPKENEPMEKELVRTTVEVDAAVEKKEMPEVAGRLAAEFGGAPETYLSEHERLHASWGQLSIAHTIVANAKEPITVDQIITLRQEGLGWGQIAHGMDVNVGEFKKMAQTKGRAVGGPAGAKAERAVAKADPGAKANADANAKGKSDASVKGKPDATEKGKPEAVEAKNAKAKTK